MRQISNRRPDYLRPLLLCLAVLAILALRPFLAAAARRDVGHGWMGRSDFGATIVIADFDGDEQLDMATVSVAGADTQATTYCIQFHFTQEPDSDFGLTARGGGLDLSSRDVNGDSILDLVVSTALDSKMVAVLLNDGHGRFSLASPSNFPELITDSLFYLQIPCEPPHDLSAFAMPRLPFGEEPRQLDYSSAPKSSRLLGYDIEKNPRKGIFFRHLGRSPPISFLTA
jgi:hypothetical protein